MLNKFESQTTLFFNKNYKKSLYYANNMLYIYNHVFICSRLLTKTQYIMKLPVIEKDDHVFMSVRSMNV